ncbi:MAG TPA: hypothetical protein VNB90_00585 [Cytophagaceae bacterium]|nr:hypothetical protein [Cytophagaceae bacterium]
MKKYSIILVALLLLADLIYSFVQHIHMPLDGDMCSIILFENGYRTILDDPFGMRAFLHNEIYSAPNRFFAHWTMSAWFKTVPFFFQHFTNPIDSVYLACGVAKIIFQVGLIYMLALYITGCKKIWSKEWLLAALLVTPLFQTSGYNIVMGIIDKSVTYSFFYALPLVLLIIYFYPFYKEYFSGKPINFSFLQMLLWSLLPVYLALNGPLVPGVVIILSTLYLTHRWWIAYQEDQRSSFLKRIFSSILKIPFTHLFYFVLFGLACLYSLYIGKNNIENQVTMIPLVERFARLPVGLFNLFTKKLGPVLLLVFIILNIFLLRKTELNAQGRKILVLAKWILIFSIIYILLLPFGGYRPYRPNIIRWDTFMPVMLGMIFIYGLSTYYILTNLELRRKIFYQTSIAIFMLIFTIADEPMTTANACEKDALQKIAASTQPITVLHNDCSVLDWRKISDYRKSETNAKLIKMWKITEKEKLYYQE